MVDNHDINVRVGKLETNITGLSDNQKALANDIRDFVKSVDSGFATIHAKIDTWTDKLFSSGKINWQALAAVFAICTAVVGYYVSSRVNPLETRIETIETLSLKTAVDLEQKRVETQEAFHVRDDRIRLLERQSTQLETWVDLWGRGLLVNPHRDTP